MQIFYKAILYMTERLKFLLVAIFPLEFLRKIKRKLTRQILLVSEENEVKAFERNAFPDGFNLIGAIRKNIGLGESNRLLAKLLETTVYPLNIYNYSPINLSGDSDNSWDEKINNEFIYNINIFHVNFHEFPLAVLNLGRDKLNKRYNIAFWLWELEEFPDEFVVTSRFLNEIWTPSEFVTKSIQSKIKIPVYTIPYYLDIPATNKKYDRKYFSLPEKKILFLCMFDSLSAIERKNPFGAVNAFKKAFRPEQNDVGLVIKINNALDSDFQAIMGSLTEYKNIYVLCQSMDKTEVNSLIKCCDVFVSLHRAEGFGLVMAEAMLLQVPTIATNWSANTEFMNDKVACMVDFSYVNIEEDYSVYKANSRWAEPDFKNAAMYMQKLYIDKDYYERIRNNAFEYITKKFSKQNALAAVNSRIKKIYKDSEV